MSDLLPPNATPQERAIAEAVARISDVPADGARAMWNPDTCPASLLPWMAWAFGVDFWEPSWSEEQKRGAIKSAVAVQRYKGTIGAVKEAMGALGFAVTIQEWFQMIPEGNPYTFDVIVETSQVGIDDGDLAKIISFIERTKNLRSHLRAGRQVISPKAGPIIAGALCMGQEVTVRYDGPYYSDGTVATDLLLDAATYGEASTAGAIDLLDQIVTADMPNNSWGMQ
ncbi:putative tail protein II [Ralstonia phage phiRSP]|uniref:Putative tail protein II n=1 Tax=Ralstonia phage phiRSP TaxID=2201420 RepID=A0A345ANT5_9CAUD|nr:tail protein [Ralstonia phage phiRSP]AXF38224.1 putative tail protein II [Ralstonia phage phiRSP]